MLNFYYQNYSIILIIFFLLNNEPTTTTTTALQTYRRRTSNTCQFNNDCPNHAYCEHNTASTENGQCVCNEGFLIVAENRTRECTPVAKTIGDSCNYDEQCMYTLSTEAECKNHICQCKEGTHFIKRENTCYKSVKVGDFCRLTNNCIGNGTTCQSGFCHCPINTHPNADLTGCLTNVKLGELCNNDYECIVTNSKCHDVCRCKVSHIISSDHLRCIRIADQINSECEEDIQCQARISNTVCGDNNTCVCRDDYHELNYQCWVSVPLGGICEKNENCIIHVNSKCIDGYCECAEGFTMDNGICSSCLQKT